MQQKLTHELKQKNISTQKEVLGKLGQALTQEFQPSEVTQCQLKKDLIFIIKIVIGLHETVTKSKLEVEQSFTIAKVQQKFDPSEALGLSTYTIEAPNSFLKIREAWLPKLDINKGYPPLAQQPPSGLIWLFVLRVA